MNPAYILRDLSNVLSPGLLFYKDLIRKNIARVVEIAGDPSRVRPHVKTHKTREIILLEMDAGITKHKCATIAEAEMLAGCGVTDIFLAYNLVGPNCHRMAELVKVYAAVRFCVQADHPAAVRALSEAMTTEGQKVEVLLDLDVGQHRTGIAPGSEALALYELIDQLPGLEPGGFHVYDGHNHQDTHAERQAAVERVMGPVLDLRSALLKKSLPVPRMVMGGTPTFPVYATMDLPGLECAPGTCILQDHGYGTHFPDIAGFTPAALVLTRVISRPTSTRITFDLGYKAIASDPPAGQRCVLLNVPDYKTVLQNEEHLVVETPAAERFSPGDTAYALPTHICPTCALHRQVYVVEDGQVTETWDVVARDRMLAI